MEREQMRQRNRLRWQEQKDARRILEWEMKTSYSNEYRNTGTERNAKAGLRLAALQEEGSEDQVQSLWGQVAGPGLVVPAESDQSHLGGWAGGSTSISHTGFYIFRTTIPDWMLDRIR